MNGELYPGEFEAMEHNGRMDALEQESCENWCDVPSDEMTLEQARQAVKDLRKKLAEYLEQEPCENAISREDALMCLTGEWTEITDEIIHRFIKRIKALPPVNPQPDTAHWIIVEELHGEWEGTKKYACDKCGEKVGVFKSNYCPNCGRRMVDKQEGSEE